MAGSAQGAGLGPEPAAARGLPQPAAGTTCSLATLTVPDGHVRLKPRQAALLPHLEPGASPPPPAPPVWGGFAVSLKPAATA